MSTTTLNLKDTNKRLYRALAFAGSGLLWCGLGYLALNYVPQIQKPIERDGPIVQTYAPPKPVDIDPPKPPVKPPEVKKDQPATLTPTTTPAPSAPITTRASTSKRANPLQGELPAGPVASEPVTFAPADTSIGGGIAAAPIEAPPIPDLPIVEAPPAPPPAPVIQLVVDPVKLSGVNPTYPTRALEREIMGDVTLSFTVSPTGKVENLSVINEEPRGYGFARAAREAIQGWTFQPQTIDGVPVAYPARYTISFKLAD